MIPRGRLDIGWGDLAYGALACVTPGDRGRVEREVQALSAGPEAFVCLSVRSGLDLLLTVMDYPRGSEILVTAVTIRNMVDIIEHHGLVAVPVDMDMETLSAKQDSLEGALSPRTKAVLAAHIFGSRMDLDRLGDFAKAHDLLLIEDCAQSFTADGYWGHPSSDVSLSSFGPLKTATALGGAVAVVRDRSLRSRMRECLGSQPLQGRWTFFRRILRFAIVRLLGYPSVFSAYYAMCRWMGRNHDDILSRSLRGFAGERLYWRLRHQPSYPLLALLARRLRSYGAERAVARAAAAEMGDRAMADVPRPGRRAVSHWHWAFPVLDPRPDELARYLWEQGFDATRGRWSLHVVDPPDGADHLRAEEASSVMCQVVYVPVHPAVPRDEVRRLAESIRAFRRHRA